MESVVILTPASIGLDVFSFVSEPKCFNPYKPFGVT